MRSLAAQFLAWGPPGVFVLAALDSTGIPLPGGVDALLIFVAAAHPRLALLSALLAVAGSALGCMVLFYLARKGGELYLERHTLSTQGRRLRQWFQHYGLLTVFIPALVPIPLPVKIFVICAGALGVKPLSFLAVVAAARVPRYLALAYLGSKLGRYSLTWLRENALALTAAAIALFAVLYGVIRWMDWQRARAGR